MARSSPVLRRNSREMGAAGGTVSRSTALCGLCLLSPELCVCHGGVGGGPCRAPELRLKARIPKGS